MTPLGDTAGQTWDRLLAGDFIIDHARTNAETAPGRPRVTELALRAARQAIHHAGWSADDLSSESTALLIGTSKGPIENWIISPSFRSDNLLSAGRVHGFGLSEIAATLADQLGLGLGPRLTVSAACASGLHVLIRAALMLQSGQVRRAIVVASESSLHPLFIGSFQRLGVLPRAGVGCRPFDRDREGFLMSEAAAAVCLEAGEAASLTAQATLITNNDSTDPLPASQSMNRVLAKIERFALGGDATHLTAGDPGSATLRNLLRRVVDHRPVDLIHAHGTATVINDPLELAAIESVVSGIEMPAPAIYSHKGALGHSLGAAGLVSVVLNCLAHMKAIVPPNVQTLNPLPTRNVSLAREAQRRSIRRSVAIAAGFGGPMAVVSLVSP